MQLFFILFFMGKLWILSADVMKPDAELLRVFLCLTPTVQELQDHLPALRWPVLLHLCGRDRQQPGIPRSHPQLCGGN